MPLSRKMEPGGILKQPEHLYWDWALRQDLRMLHHDVLEANEIASALGKEVNETRD